MDFGVYAVWEERILQGSEEQRKEQTKKTKRKEGGKGKGQCWESLSLVGFLFVDGVAGGGEAGVLPWRRRHRPQTSAGIMSASLFVMDSWAAGVEQLAILIFVERGRSICAVGLYRGSRSPRYQLGAYLLAYAISVVVVMGPSLPSRRLW
ncbi:hypothetical protein CRG98_022001 [Punica granatum]|uniref:Uncharacterized protein n=1 Tax=Punica granatum TaxID=22663 RepID=A0A2I0JP23_PUNGR|nr:hypothetical protein CRG98_022001 [Punica granatum]